jgi:polar amino acid transport system substrate-binding protein
MLLKLSLNIIGVKKITLLTLSFFILFQASAEVLRVGMELSYPPFEMTNKKGEPDGISVGIAQALAKFLKRDLKIENMSFDGLIPALKTGSIDIIISSLTVNEERKKSIDFSEPYVNTGLALLVSKNSSIQNEKDLDQKNFQVAVKKGTTAQAWALKNLKEAKILAFDKENSAVLEVIQNKANAFIYDQMSIYHHWKKSPEQTKALLQAFQKESWAIGVKKGNPELTKKINLFIQDFRKKKGFSDLADKFLKDEKNIFKTLGVDFIL